jgi:hypothetical protein
MSWKVHNWPSSCKEPLEKLAGTRALGVAGIPRYTAEWKAVFAFHVLLDVPENVPDGDLSAFPGPFHVLRGANW